MNQTVLMPDATMACSNSGRWKEQAGTRSRIFRSLFGASLSECIRQSLCSTSKMAR